MELEFVQFISKPFLSNGVKVTRENMADIAIWCEGEIETLPPQSVITTSGTAAVKYIKVPTFKPQNARQTMAFVGDWVMKSDSGFKVYKQKPLDKGFDRVNTQDQLVRNPAYFDPALIEIVSPLRSDNALPPLSDVQIFDQVVEELKNNAPSLKHLSKDMPSPAMFDNKKKVA